MRHKAITISAKLWSNAVVKKVAKTQRLRHGLSQITKTFRRYGLGYAKPTPVPYKKLIKSGYLIQGKTIEDLARQIGADPVQMAKTVQEFNKHAVKGEDPEFGKGSASYNRSLGDLITSQTLALHQLQKVHSTQCVSMLGI